MPPPRALLLVGLGSAGGAAARVWLGTTLLANTLGTLILACLLTVLVHPGATSRDEESAARAPSGLAGGPSAAERTERWRADLQLLLGAGLCGGLTSYSALMIQSLRSASFSTAAAGLALDFTCSLGAAILGIGLARLGIALSRASARAGVRAHARDRRQVAGQGSDS